MLKILQARPQQYVNHEFPDVQASFRKGRGTRLQIVNILWIIEKAREFQEKNIYISALLTMPKPLTVWITTKCGKFLKRWEYQDILPDSWKICMHVKNQQLELDMEQLTGSKLGKRVYQGWILTTYLFNLYAVYIMWNARLDETQAGIKIDGRNINNLGYADDTTLTAESKELSRASWSKQKRVKKLT